MGERGVHRQIRTTATSGTDKTIHMKGKKSFLLYADIKETLDELSNEEAGELFKLISDYVNDLDPEPEGKLMRVTFKPIKAQLKRDLQKWSGIIAKRSRAGKISAIQKEILSTSVEQCPTDSTVNVNVNVNDSVKWDKLIEAFNLIFEKRAKVISEPIRKKYRARLKEGYTKKDIIKAMREARKDDYHKETNFKYCTLEFFSRPDKLDRFMNQETSTKYTPTK